MSGYDLLCLIARFLKRREGVSKLSQVTPEDWQNYGEVVVTLKGGKRFQLLLRELED